MKNTSLINTKAVMLAGLLVAATSTQIAHAAAGVDPSIPTYKRSGTVSGNLNSIGSDTLNNLMTLWAEDFRKIYPSVRIQIEGKGSSTAPPALLEGTAQLGPMSRAMKPEELDRLEARFGFKPTQVAVALDSLGVFVHRDNPIKSLSIEQVDAVFSKNRKCGGAKAAKTWGDLGLAGAWASKPISAFGRNSASGTYGYFKKVALCKGDYANVVKEQPGSSSVINGIASDKNGIGYSGIGYKTSSVRAIPLSKKTGDTAYEPNYENVIDKKYPLGRALYVYYMHKPGTKLDPMVAEFIKFVLSKAGQEIVVKDGYLPLTKGMVDKQLKSLQ